MRDNAINLAGMLSWQVALSVAQMVCQVTNQNINSAKCNELAREDVGH
jgi:hypothetical protein